MDKGKRPRVESSKSNSKIFEHSTVKPYYKEKVCVRNILAETSLEFRAIKGSVRHEEGIRAPIVTNDWHNFIRDPEDVMSKTLVWEFYAHAWYRAQKGMRQTSWVRGKQVSFSKENIAKVLGLPNYAQPTDFTVFYDREMQNTTCYDELKNLLILPGNDWNYSSTSERRIKHVLSKHLTPLARFWAYFVMHNIEPNSHDTEVKISVLLVVFGLIKGWVVDAAHLISYWMNYLSTKKVAGYLGFPWVITLLCNDAGVYFADDFRDLRRTPTMTIKTFARYRQIAAQHLTAPLSQPSSPRAPPEPDQDTDTAAPNPPAPAQSNDMAEMMKMMKRLMKAQQRELKRNQIRDGLISAIGEEMGVPFNIEPYSENELSMIYTSDEEED